MLKKKKYQKKQILIIVITVFLIIISVFHTITKGNNYLKLEKIVHDIGVKLESIFIPKVKNYSNNLIDGINKEILEENKELKKILELDLNQYHLIHADVIRRKINWYQELTINKGEKDGIKVEMAVISNQGLIGKIIKTGNTFSVVKLLSSNSNDMKIAVDIKNEDEYIHGILDGYLENESLIQINNVSKISEIKLGNKVYTNGLGGIYPAGIYIGQVVEVTTDTLGLNKIVKVKPDSSYDKLRYVSVVDRGNIE